MPPQPQRARDLGIRPGRFPTAPLNAITDVPGVHVGHHTRIEGEAIRTGVTAILPHNGNLFQHKTPAALAVGNGYGKLAGATQLNELGQIETPILLTGTLSVHACIHAAIRYTLDQPGNQHVTSVNAVVGETNDSYLHDARGLHLTTDDALHAIANAKDGSVAEGVVGAGTGTSCFGFKGGIGTASRQLDTPAGTHRLGVLVQANYDGELTVAGVPVGHALQNAEPESPDGSCMIVLATDAPMTHRQLERLAARALLGLARTGSHLAHGSGDYAIAFSTAYHLHEDQPLEAPVALLTHRACDPFFAAAVETTEEAVLNALCTATPLQGHHGRRREALPLDRLVTLLRQHHAL
jgi:D-aminopeptidase